MDLNTTTLDALCGRVATRVAEEIRVQGISRPRLGELAGIARESVSAVCAGRPVSLRTLHAVASALGTRVDLLTRP